MGCTVNLSKNLVHRLIIRDDFLRKLNFAEIKKMVWDGSIELGVYIRTVRVKTDPNLNNPKIEMLIFSDSNRIEVVLKPNRNVRFGRFCHQLEKF